VCLREAPRSLHSLAREHPHGWGLAVFADAQGWTLKKHAGSAHGDNRFHEVAMGSRGAVVVAHIRKRTVGPISVENTHPFTREGWVFAHNGTIEDVDWLRRGTSSRRQADILGETDSEIFFAFLLSRLDDAGLAAGASNGGARAVLLSAIREITARPGFGSANFILSDGESLYAYRQGRTLFMLERGPQDEVRSVRRSAETGAEVDTGWTARRTAVLVASERMTDEPWLVVEEGTLLLIRRKPVPTCVVVTKQAGHV
jgi:predicted glutamine amidotransferase